MYKYNAVSRLSISRYVNLANPVSVFNAIRVTDAYVLDSKLAPLPAHHALSFPRFPLNTSINALAAELSLPPFPALSPREGGRTL